MKKLGLLKLLLSRLFFLNKIPRTILFLFVVLDDFFFFTWPLWTKKLTLKIIHTEYSYIYHFLILIQIKVPSGTVVATLRLKKCSKPLYLNDFWLVVSEKKI